MIASDLDAARSGLSNVTVIPNTYPRPPRPAGNPAAAGPPVVLFQGTLWYPPNIDAAEWLAERIAPRIRAAVPAAEVRLVGRPSTSVTRLHRPGVLTVVGQVPSMEEELARASVAVVPIRYGGGTRVKILESFAHRVPVVSTTLGAEGLDVEDDVHLLLADDPDEFAAAIVRLLGDSRLRLRLTAAAETLYLERYESRVADEAVRRLVEDVAASAPVRRRPSSWTRRPDRRIRPRPCVGRRCPCGDGGRGRAPAPRSPRRVGRSRGAGRAVRICPWETTCRQPRMSVAITGRPLAAASMADRGKPSRYEGSTKRSKPG